MSDLLTIGPDHKLTMLGIKYLAWTDFVRSCDPEITIRDMAECESRVALRDPLAMQQWAEWAQYWAPIRMAS